MRCSALKENKQQLAAKSLGEKPSDAAEASGKERAELEARLAALEGALEVEKSQSEDYLRRLQYLQADFENYRKRVEKEIGEAKRFENDRLLSDLLVVNDELELALAEAKESGENPVFLQGVEMIHKRLQGLLSKEGVQRIQSLGAKFTPDLHEAALRVPSDNEEGTVVEEIRAGYLLKGRVLRPSIVKVAGKQPSVETRDNEEKKK